VRPLLPSPPVLPLVLVVAGIVLFGAGLAVLRSFGAGARIGRLLAAAPLTTVADARVIAASGETPYIRVDGRIDSTDEFPDEHDRPLVFRRSRLEVRARGGWRILSEDVRRVPFSIDEGLDSIEVDTDAIADGLVVLARESTGTAADVPDRVPAGTARSAPVRLRIEQVSAVEHATVLGVPVVGPDGSPRLTRGRGRPLVVCTLERDDAMRVLAEGRRGRAAVATILLIGGPATISVGLAAALLGILG
jgi:hypothetical protein